MQPFRDRTSRIRTAKGHDVIEAGNIAEHAALRRVAQLGASGLPPPEVLEAVAVEASALMDDRVVTLVRLEDDGHGVVVAVSSPHAPLGLRFALEGDSVAARILLNRQAERIDDYPSLPGISPAEDLGVRAAVGVPITITGRLCGLVAGRSTRRSRNS